MKYNTENFILKAIEIHSQKYDYSLINYINSVIKVKIICPIHGLFEQLPSSHIIKKQGCPECAGVKKMTQNEFLEKVNKIHKNKYDYSLVKYTNNKTKIKIICKEHGVFETRPDNHLNCYSGCPKCANNILYSTEDFIEKANKIHKNKFDYSLVNYKTAHIKVKIICYIHGIFEQKPNSHLNKIGCPKCVGRNMSIDEFIEKSNKIHNNKYDYSLVDYKNKSDKIKIICQKHGIFKQCIKSHLNGHGCVRCKESEGEKEVCELLDKMNIKYVREKRFKECKYKLPLPFDFYLPELNTCIEYDGIQHFMKVNYWGGNISLSSQQKRDKIKTQFCLDNGIKLIRIRYDDDINEKMFNYFRDF